MSGADSFSVPCGQQSSSVHTWYWSSPVTVSVSGAELETTFNERRNNDRITVHRRVSAPFFRRRKLPVADGLEPFR